MCEEWLWYFEENWTVFIFGCEKYDASDRLGSLKIGSHSQMHHIVNCDPWDRTIWTRQKQPWKNRNKKKYGRISLTIFILWNESQNTDWSFAKLIAHRIIKCVFANWKCSWMHISWSMFLKAFNLKVILT